MSLSSENSSLSGSSLRSKDHRSASAIAAFNKRRLHGDYGLQPNAPSVGVKTAGEDANTSALKAVGSKLGPKLWYPSETPMAARASSLATSSSASFIPDAHFVPKSTNEASRAATSAIAIPGEEYGARHQPEAYKWGKQPSQWQHLGANSSVAASQRASSRSLAQQSGGTDTLNLKPAPQAIDISKVLATAERNARNRLASADNHLPENFGIPTAEQQAQRRQQVLSLITIADKRVKDQMALLDRDATAGQVFNSVEFQKIAMEISARRNAPRMENFGKRDLGGGLFMTQDEIDDIARRHVQPVLDKVTLVADKKRITDREQAQREAQLREAAQAEKEREKQRKALEKQQSVEDKQRRKQHEADAKLKAERASQRSKEQHPEGSHLWHWQQVEIIKDDVKESKNVREEKQERYNRVRKQHDQAKEDLAALIERHHELKRDYFQRGEQIDQKASQYDNTNDDAETASLFSLKQRRETVKTSTLTAKNKRSELEATVQRLETEEQAAKREADEAADRHHELKKKYFDAREVAEQEEKKFQAEEEARLQREAEERAQREAEAAERAQREAEERTQREAEAAERSRAEASQRAAAGASAPAASAPASAASSKPAGKASKKGKEEPAAPASKPVDEVPADFKMPAKSKLISLGDARSGPILSGYKAPAPSKAAESKGAEAPEAGAAEDKAGADETKDKAVDGAESKEATEPKGAAKDTDAKDTSAVPTTGIIASTDVAPLATDDKSAEPAGPAPGAATTEPKESKESNSAVPVIGDATTEHIASAPVTDAGLVPGATDSKPKDTSSVPATGIVATTGVAPLADTQDKSASGDSKTTPNSDKDSSSHTIVEKTNLKATSEEPELSKSAASLTPASSAAENSRSSSEEPTGAGASKIDKKADKKAKKKAEKAERLAEFAEKKAESNRKAEAIRKAEEEKKSRNITSDEAEAIFDKAIKEVKSESSNTTSPADQFKDFDSSNVKEQVKEAGVFKEEI